MAPNKKRNAGRQLLITRSRLRNENDSARIASLRRLEANLLIELRRFEEAVSTADALLEDAPGDGSAAAFSADILSRAGRWRRAEERFVLARERCLASGRMEKAKALALGPLYLLAEARGDRDRCLELVPEGVLRHRTLRLSGSPAGPPPAESGSPWREIALLETVHAGGDPLLLEGVLDRWTTGEGEWRWRILFEGSRLWSRASLDLKQWREYLRRTGKTVLDPRYPGERKKLKGLFSQGFVNRGR